MIRVLLKILFMSLLLISQGACLKTRAQLLPDQSPPDDEQTSENTESAGQPRAAAKYEIEDIKAEITRLSGRLDELDHVVRSQGPASDQKEALSKLEARVVELEKNQILIMTELKALKDHAAVSSEDSGAVLQSANQLLKEKKFEAACEKFHSFLDRKPKGNDAAEAHFGAGECEYALKNYKKAIVEFSKVQEASAKSIRIPGSLYRLGLSFKKLNMKKEADGFFAELVERYPRSFEAKKVKSKKFD